jgi:transcription elongation factor SPT6
MYRKEECLSLLKDLERPEAGDENWDKNDKTPTLKWHKACYDLFFSLLFC